LALGVYGVALINRQTWRRSSQLLTSSVLLGLAASSVYWVRMVSELKWIGVNNVNPDMSVDYRQNFVFSTLSPENPTVWWVNILTVSTSLFFVPALVLFFRRARGQVDFAKL